MKLSSLAILFSIIAAPLAAAEDTPDSASDDKSFSVTLDPVANGSLEFAPPLPEDGKFRAGTTVTVKARPSEGFALDSIYFSVPGRWGAMYHESLTPEFEITIDQDKHIGASFIKADEVDHVEVKHNVVYAKPGAKPLKYDVYSPQGAAKLPIIVIIHGGGWSTNDEDIMRGLARELTKGGKFVVCSVDYRWLGNLDGDENSNAMANLVEDVFGAIAHIMEHAEEYGGDASRIGVTGDSAGGHLSAAAALLVDKIGTGGFGEAAGVFEFKPTYLPEGKSIEEVREAMSSAIKAAAPSYGVFSADALGRFQRGSSEEGAKAVAPESHIPAASERHVPHFLLRGTTDFLIPDGMVGKYAEALRSQGHVAIYEQVEGAGHAFFDWKPNDEVKATFAKYGVPYAAKMKAFFEEHLYETSDAPTNAAAPSPTGSAPKNVAERNRKSGNPVLGGWYADPEGIIFGDTYWIYPTYSAPYDEQVFFDCFSSRDLVTWTKHPRVLDSEAITWAKRAMWAPSVVEKEGKYYFFFGANDIQGDEEVGGIGVAVADSPAGPFKDRLGKPLIGKFHHGAQPIDQFVFKNADGTYYLLYGGWRHCNIAHLNDDFTGFTPFDDGSTFKEITPAGYVEGPCMFIRDGKYYFMWSEGGWTGPDYSVAYAIADSPFGPFERVAKVLEQDPEIATGAGHHSVIHVPGTDEYYAVYHRRPLGETDRNARVTCIDRMEFDEAGFIQPIRITHEGVPGRPL